MIINGTAKAAALMGLLDSSWSVNEQDAGVLEDLPQRNSKYTYGCIIYNFGLHKYLATAYSVYWWPGEPRDWTSWGSGLPRYHLYASDHPWGPWNEAGSFSLWGSTVGEYFMCNKFTSTDGKKMWICTSGSLPIWVGWKTHAPWHYGFQYMPVYFSKGEVVRYEAESAVRSGAVNVQRSYPACSGSGYAAGLASPKRPASF